MNGENWYDVQHGRPIITPDWTTKEEYFGMKVLLRHFFSTFFSRSLTVASRLILRDTLLAYSDQGRLTRVLFNNSNFHVDIKHVCKNGF